MYYREQLLSGNVVVTDDSGNVRIFDNHADADYYEYNNNSDFNWKTKYSDGAAAGKLPELTPQEQIEAMFSEVLIPDLWPEDLIRNSNS